MKWFFRTFLYTLFAIWLTEQIIAGFDIQGGLLPYLTVTSGMVGLNIFVKPLLKIITLPLNVATLGLFSIVINGALLYLLAYFVEEIVVTSWQYPGYELTGVSLPPLEFGIIATYLTTAFLISGIIAFLQWIRQ